MLSRRGVRIKILQLLYRFDRDSYLKPKDAVRYYKEDIRSTYNLFLFNLYTLIQITKQTLKDSKKKKTKHIITDFDKIFTPKLYTNDYIQTLIKNSALNRLFEDLKFSEYHDEDFYGKVYKTYSKEEEFIKYIEDSENDHVVQILDMFRFCRQNEYFNEKMSDFYARWSEDKSMVVGAVKKYFKGFHTEGEEYYSTLFPDDETITEFGQQLLEDVIEKDKELTEMIHPVLENWDASRLAIIDTIIIKMALSEFLDFQTIPTKVTLNEYVELAKLYSTPKSKEFVNGVLDKLMKQLESNKLINKKGRGLID